MIFKAATGCGLSLPWVEVSVTSHNHWHATASLQVNAFAANSRDVVIRFRAPPSAPPREINYISDIKSGRQVSGLVGAMWLRAIRWVGWQWRPEMSGFEALDSFSDRRQSLSEGTRGDAGALRTDQWWANVNWNVFKSNQVQFVSA